MGTDNQYGRLS